MCDTWQNDSTKNRCGTRHNGVQDSARGIQQRRTTNGSAGMLLMSTTAPAEAGRFNNSADSTIRHVQQFRFGHHSLQSTGIQFSSVGAARVRPRRRLQQLVAAEKDLGRRDKPSCAQRPCQSQRSTNWHRHIGRECGALALRRLAGILPGSAALLP